jgi:large subunit ribosomal protein L19e
MSVKLTRRIAARIMKRGETKVLIKKDAVADAQKAITADDVRDMIKSGKIYVRKEKRNASLRSSIVSMKKAQGRRRGPGRRKGSAKSRSSVDYKKSVRGQRRVLKKLKADNTIDNQMYKKFYRLVKGGTFKSKGSLISQMQNNGISINEETAKQLRHI